MNEYIRNFKSSFLRKLRTLRHNVNYLSHVKVDTAISATRSHVNAVYEYAKDGLEK